MKLSQSRKDGKVLLLFNESILGSVSFGMVSLACAAASCMEQKNTKTSNDNTNVDEWNDLNSLKIYECAKLNAVPG